MRAAILGVSVLGALGLRGPALVPLALPSPMLAAAAAEGPIDAPSPGAPGPGAHPSGIFTHGDSGDFVEDAYGRPPERAPPEEGARRKRDPGVGRTAPAR